MKSDLLTMWVIIAVIAAIWELIWKGMALWKAGQRNQKEWFIALLIFNSIGILPIIYLLSHKDTAHAVKSN